jgi:regulatory protein
VSEDFDSEVKRALGYLLKATSARPVTEAEAQAKLAARDIDGDVAEAALGQAKKLGALDDAAFARAWVEDRGRRRGYSAARLRTELARRQVPDELIEAALGALDDRDDLAAATELARQRAQRMPAHLPPETVARRVAAFVARRGYPPSLAERAAMTATRVGEHWD